MRAITICGKAHFETLDGLRGIAALCVVASHVFELATPELAHDPFRHAGLSVDFFFDLSGFVMAYAYDDRLSLAAKPAKRLTLGSFFVRHLIRLHPMVLAGMTLGLISYLADPFVGPGRGPAWPLLLLVDGLSLLLLPEPNLPNRMGETHCLNGPAWSLFSEHLGNIAYASVLHRLTVRALAGLAAIIALGLVRAVARFDSIGHGWDLQYWWLGPVRLAYPFTAGMLIHRLKLRARMPYAYIWLSLVLLILFTAPLMGSFNSIIEAIWVIFGFPLMLVLGTGRARHQGHVGAICRFTGRLSYALYMVHYPAMYIFAHWLWSRRPPTLIVCIVGVGLYLGTVLAAWLVMKVYDDPVRAYLTRRLLPGQAQQ